MDCAEGVIGRRVKRVKFEGAVSLVDDVVSSSGGNDDGVISVDCSFLAEVFSATAHKYLGVSAFNADELVYIRVHFHTNLSTDGNAHQCQLHMSPRPKRRAEILIHFCCVVYIKYKRFRAEITNFGMFTAILLVHGDTSLFGFSISICKKLFIWVHYLNFSKRNLCLP